MTFFVAQQVHGLPPEHLMRDLLQAEQLPQSVTDETFRGDEIIPWAFSCLFAESLATCTWSVTGIYAQPDQYKRQN